MAASPLALLRSRGGEESHLPLDFRAAALRAFDLGCVQLRHVEKLSELFFTGLAAEDVLRHRNLHRQQCSTAPILPPSRGAPSPAWNGIQKKCPTGRSRSARQISTSISPPSTRTA